MQRPLPVLAALALAACAGPQSTLDPAGPGAREAAMLWWPMLVVATLVLAGVTALWIVAMRRRDVPRREDAGRSGRRWIVGGGVLLPGASIVLLLGFGVPAGQRMLGPAGGEALRIEVTARQWEWEVRYPESGVVLYDELHLPRGRPVDIHLATDDVIHSFWVPALGRKLDAIPGRTHVLRLMADRAGSLRGQCSEFCGREHALMVLQVEVHEPADFAAWLARRGRT